MGRGRHRGQRLRLRLAAEARRARPTTFCATFELMHQGKMNGYFCQGFNPLLSFPNRKKITEALSKLKFLVVMDPLDTETARFWENHGEYNDVDQRQDRDRSDPAADDLLCRGRRLADEFRALAAMALGGGTPPGEAKHDTWIMAQIYLRLKALYHEGRRGVPGADRQPALALQGSERADARGTRQGDQRLRDRRHDRSERSDQGRPAEGQAGRQLRRRCATTARPPAAAGSIPAASTRRATTWPAATRRTRTTPASIPKWAWSWPLNRRVLYNRASCRSFTASRGIRAASSSWWDGSQMVRLRRARHRADRQAGGGRPVHHERRRHRAAVHPGDDARRAVPGALRAVRSRRSPMSVAPKMRGNPAARVFKDDLAPVRRGRGIPLCGDLVPADRALPLLDQARLGQRRAAAGVLRRNFGRARQGEGHRRRRLGPGVVETRLDSKPRRS